MHPPRDLPASDLAYPLPPLRQPISHVLALSSTCADGEDDPGRPVSVSGRVRAVRVHGALAFIDVADDTGQIQLMLLRRSAPEEHAAAGRVQVGDVIHAAGRPARSRSGELTVLCTHLQMLAPALRPHPEPGSDVTETETLRRHRTLDLTIHDRPRELLIARSRIVQALRQSLLADEYLEVETPILQAEHTGEQAGSFTTEVRSLGQTRHLRTAPEFDLERLVTAGLPRVFEFARNFRNEGSDRTHSPEFTALEWYEAHATVQSQQDRCQRLLRAAGAAAGCTRLDAVASRSFDELWAEHVGGDWRDLACSAGDDAPAQLDHAWSSVEARLIDPVFVTDWPAALSPLARPLDDDPELASRWDLYAGGIELGAGYQEINDPALQRELMGRSPNEAMLSDMLLGMPPMAGAGLGVDRLVMLLTGAAHIRDVLSFPDFRR
jgi:lysyl-tRNA synthetase class 2